MSKVRSIILCMLLVFTMSCGTASKDNDEHLKIVTTIFPTYDWLVNLTTGVEDVEIKLLLDQGIDLHNYQPSADDMITISTCDLLVFVGGESDDWVLDAPKDHKNQVRVSLFDLLENRLKEEEIIEGMEAEEEEEDAYDEHVWLSLRNTIEIITKLKEQLIHLDSKNKELYESNAQAYIAKLETLDHEFETMIKAAPVKTILVGDRFPFRYFVDDYGLNYYAAFVGCSAETEASFETVRFLSEKMDEEDLQTVFILENSNDKLANTIIQNTKEKNQSIEILNSIQSIKKEQLQSGVTYLGLMEENYEVLKKVLNNGVH